MSRHIQSGATFPERMEKHAKRNWYDLSFNHKTTLTMGLLVPLAIKEVNPGETVKLQTEIKTMFAGLYLPIMHQCYLTQDWYFVTNRLLWPKSTIGDYNNGWEMFIKQDPITGAVTWPYLTYSRANAVSTEGVLNYMGFNAPPPSGTLILDTEVGALPVNAYLKIYDEYYRNDQIQPTLWRPLLGGDNTTNLTDPLPGLKVLRRNWPRDYYTSATPTPQQGENILIPSFATDPVTGDFIPQILFKTDGTSPSTGSLRVGTSDQLQDALSADTVLQLSSTIRDFRYAAQMTEYLERSMRAGDRYNDFIQRHFGWTPDPLYIDRPVWIGGFTSNVVISQVLATAEVGTYSVGQYAGQAMVRDVSPEFTYTCPDYGLVMSLMTIYPKASYYSGLEQMWTRRSKMDYMWEQFALIGDQPIKNKEVWFSWYDADIAWNDEIFGYLPQYASWKYSNDIVSGQMRTLWQSFHLGRKFEGAGEVVLNSEFITCTPDVGRVFVIDAEAGEHECYVHAYNKILINRALPESGVPQL